MMEGDCAEKAKYFLCAKTADKEPPILRKFYEIERLNNTLNDLSSSSLCTEYLSKEAISSIERNAITIADLRQFTEWLREVFRSKTGDSEGRDIPTLSLMWLWDVLKTRSRASRDELVCMFVALLRSLDIECRIVASFNRKDVIRPNAVFPGHI